MKRNYQKLLLATVIMMVIGFSLSTEATALPVYEGDYVDMYLKFNTWNDLVLVEEEVFLIKDEAGVIYGSIDKNSDEGEVVFSSTTDILWAANGFATIKASDNYINNITIEAPGYLFEDLLFDVRMDKVADSLEVKVETIDGEESYSDWILGAGLNDFLVITKDFSSSIMRVTINAWDDAITEVGAEEVKHIQISGLRPVPEPATMLLLGVGLVGVAGASRKKLLKKS